MQLASTAPRPRRGPAVARCIAVIATIALAGCGARTLPTSAAHTSPTPAPSSIATPAPVPVPPLEGTDAAGNTILYNASGIATATLAAGSPDSVVSPLGNRLLAERSNAAHAVDALDAISADGSMQQLETIGDPANFIDAIGARDGRAWAWMMKGTTNGCAGQPPPPATTNVYVASKPGSEALIAQLAPLNGGAGRQWMFYQWTAAGIVLTEGGPPGCYNGPRINTDPTDLLNPSTGSVTPLTSQLGTGCVLQDMADNGTVVCAPSSDLASQSPIAASATLLRIVSRSGRSQEVTAAQFLQVCSSPMGSPYYGDMSISGDGRYVSVTQWCSEPQTVLATTWVIDAQTLAVTRVSVAGIGAREWLPGEHTLIATVENTNYGQPPSGCGTGGPVACSGTYAVSPDGQATELNSADSGGGLAHF